MRVIAGSARGRTLQTFKGRQIRPTLDRVREAVFSSLMPRLADSRIADLYAGTGAMGIEAISRGAGSVVFVDTDGAACALIHENLKICGWGATEAVRVRRLDALRWLRTETEQYDILLADPPYKKGFPETFLAALAETEVLAPEGIVVLESDARQSLPEKQGNLYLLKDRVYGDTKISYFTNAERTAQSDDF